MKLINTHIEKVKELCRKYHVAEIYAFGSVLNDRFSPHSDIDFLVRFSDINPLEYFDNYMDFKESLENLFSREVDLLEIQTLKNPILRRSTHRDKVLVYERESTD